MGDSSRRARNAAGTWQRQHAVDHLVWEVVPIHFDTTTSWFQFLSNGFLFELLTLHLSTGAKRTGHSAT